MAILTNRADIHRLLEQVRRIAVLGIKMEPWEPAYFVPAYAIAAGFDVVPVPIYYPDVHEMFGRPVYRQLRDVPPPIDLVNVFRRAERLPDHLEDIMAARPGAVWLQSGIRDDDIAARLSDAGIDVVQDRCLMVEHQHGKHGAH